MADTISASVGLRGMNSPADVATIQNLLNNVPPAQGGPVVNLIPSGTCGSSLVSAIGNFQRFHFGSADGRVDPGQSTIQKLRELGQPGAIPSPAQQPVKSAGQGSLRDYVIAELGRLLPCAYGKGNANYMWLTGGQLQITTQTNCYIMGLAVTKLAGLFKGMKDNPPALNAFIAKKSLCGMHGMLRDGRGKSAWRDAKHPLKTLDQRPRPGDLFGLLYPDKTDTPANRAQGGFMHVGVIQDPSGDVWKTMDFGQGANPGYNGVKDNPRQYDDTKGTLTGHGTRVLAGWVNIDDYFGS